MKHLKKSQKSDINTLLTTIKSGIFLQKSSVFLYHNNYVYTLCEKLYKEGLICGLNILQPTATFVNQKQDKKEKIIQIQLKSFLGINLLDDLKKVPVKAGSSFMDLEELINFRFVNTKIYFFSTSSGILTYEECIKYKLGGVLLFSC